MRQGTSEFHVARCRMPSRLFACALRRRHPRLRRRLRRRQSHERRRVRRVVPHRKETHRHSCGQYGSAGERAACCSGNRHPSGVQPTVRSVPVPGATAILYVPATTAALSVPTFIRSASAAARTSSAHGAIGTGSGCRDRCGSGVRYCVGKEEKTEVGLRRQRCLRRLRGTL